jgi:hypothetical protein
VLIWSLWIHLPESVIIFLWYCMVSIYFYTFINCFCVTSPLLSSCDFDEISNKEHVYVPIIQYIFLYLIIWITSQVFCVKIKIVSSIAFIRVIINDKQYLTQK